MQTINKEQLRELGKPAEELVELAPGQAVLVRGYTIGEAAAIAQASTVFDPASGIEIYDRKQDRLLSILAAVIEPQLTLEDTGWVQDLADGIAVKILLTAERLSGRTVPAYEDLKNSLRRNPLLRRIYSVCVNSFHRLPSELADVSEAEFMTALAAMELDAEDDKQAMDAAE